MESFFHGKDWEVFKQRLENNAIIVNTGSTKSPKICIMMIR